MLSTDGRGHFQTHEEPINDVKALSILKVHLKFESGTLKSRAFQSAFKSAYKVRIKCVQS